MVHENDWERARLDLTTRGRERAGDPPTPEEIVAYSRGELPPAEEERVREALSYYPELAKMLSETDDDEYEPLLSGAELAADWRRVQQRLPRTSEPVVPLSWPWQWATAASLALAAVLGVLYLNLLREKQQPREHVERAVLLEHTPRGTGASLQALELQPSTEYVVLTLTLLDEAPAGPFSVEMRDTSTAPPSIVWKSAITRGRDGTFSFEVPRPFLTASEYQLDLYASGKEKPIATYAFELDRK
jgi:hypothetical protein